MLQGERKRLGELIYPGWRGLEIHLVEATKRLAKRHDGFGGGYKRAGGASIPRKDCIAFIKDLEIGVC